MLVMLISEAKHENQEAMLSLIQRFNPILRRYGRKLGYEDATEDLIVDYIEFIKSFDISRLINSNDGAVKKYIAKSIYRLYLKRLRKIIDREPICVSFDELTIAQQNIVSQKMAVWNETFLAEDLPQNVLTSKEIYVLTAVYERGESVASIARGMNVSRQNINQIRKKAERKLKKSWAK